MCGPMTYITKVIELNHEKKINQAEAWSSYYISPRVAREHTSSFVTIR